MSDQLFEVAFSGQVSARADPAEVRARVGKMFNADQAKLEQLFSGRRIVIKKNIDQATANKYQTALNRAGAECEVRPMGGAVSAAPVEKPAASNAAASAGAATAASQQYETGDYGEVAPPPQTDPLGITGDQIADLGATIAPVGSELQSHYSAPEEPEIDTSGFDIAPVGTDLGSGKREPEPSPPDTSGITLAE